MKVVIVGGVAGGASAAARIRRLDETAKITVFERSGFVSYANCGLPYYIGNVITDEHELTLQTPESFSARFNIDVKVRNEVTGIDPEKKTVTVRDLTSGKDFTESYDKLLLSPGARPVTPELSGVESDRIFTLRTVEDTIKIHEFIKNRNPGSAVLVGGGFIGLEMAENLIHMGLKVTLIQRSDQVLPPFDRDMASQLHTLLRNNGVSLKLNSSVTGFSQKHDLISTIIKGETPIESDMVILAIGVSPDTALARSAGLELGIKGSIVVNEMMETSMPDIYAVGDAVEVRHSVTGQRAVISLAGPANRQGRIAADNICGGNSKYPGSQGSSVIKLFDMTAASTGINEKIAISSGIEYDKIVLSPPNHAAYYPGSTLLTMKVLWEKNTQRILGAQITGYSGVDKRIDVLSTAIRSGMKAADLAALDLAYAPPYSSAKDPVNMAGFMIENIESGIMKQFHWHDIDDLSCREDIILLDVRTTEEYSAGHIEGFRNIPVDEMRERLSELENGKPVYVMCQSGLRSYIAVRILSQKGFDCYNLSGGYRFYEMINSDKMACRSAYPCGMEIK